MNRPPFKMEFDLGTIKHLGLQMYSTLPPVIGELVSNAWDADAKNVWIKIPTGVLDASSEITVTDDGSGMTDGQVRTGYLIVGRDKRVDEGTDTTVDGRKMMGRKGIGKFSAFGIAGEIEIETFRGEEISRFIMNYDRLRDNSPNREILMPCLIPTGHVKNGTKITLRHILKFRKRSIRIEELRRGLARRFSVIGSSFNFTVWINDTPITPEERDLKRLLEIDSTGSKYLWEYNNEKVAGDIRPDLTVSGWIGALEKTDALADGIQRGVVIMARGKMVQEPFVFNAEVGQQFALSYIVGELHAEFVDEDEDTVGTTRNSLVWDSEENMMLLQWGKEQVNKIAREWSEKRRKENQKRLRSNPVYIRFLEQTQDLEGGDYVRKITDGLIQKALINNPLMNIAEAEPVIELCVDFMQFDSFQQMASTLATTDNTDITGLVKVFREFELMEAREMMRVTEQRIKTIAKLQQLIEENALEVPTLHAFLKEFPWVIDPRWTLVADEKRFSDILRKEFPEESSTLPEDRRIDFLCVGEGTSLIVVEIKRPHSKANKKYLEQIERYVSFMRDHCKKTSDHEMKKKEVYGYLLCGSTVDNWEVRGKQENLSANGIYVRLYHDLLGQVKNLHSEFLSRYTSLKEVKQRAKQLALAQENSIPSN